MRQAADQHRKMGEFNVGDLVLLNTRHIKFRQTPHKLQRGYIGPFQILQKTSKVAYKLELPENWKMHPVFHISLLKLWKQSQWSSPVDAPVPDINEDDQQYHVERILRWQWTGRGRRRTQEFLVTWEGYPMEDTQWIPASNFDDPDGIVGQIHQDQPREKPSPSGN